MSGELQVVFIYDTLHCQKERDDPREAILYFHPEEISESRRIAICGQLMGITHFLIDFFTAPRILSLENGKFALRNFGRQYVLALGCSSVTPDWLLEKQADFLYNLTRFFHKDIDSILKRANGDRDLLSCKLTSIMDHYIPISQHHGDLFALTFGILPVLNLPKSASHISLSATVTLQTCMLRNGVLGGIVMFQNKVVTVELLQNVAEKLAFIQPYQLPPADAAEPKFTLPPGVQLLHVYIKRQDLEKLNKNSSSFQYSSKCEPNKNEKDKITKGKIESIREEEPSDVSSSLGFSEPSTTSNPPSGEFSSLGAEDKKYIDVINLNEKWKMDFDKKRGIDNTAIERDKKMSSADHRPCVHRNGCGSNFLHPRRQFRSLEDLTVVLQDDNTIKTSLCSSLNDPYFPYIRCDGKSISKCLVDFYAFSNRSNTDDDEGDEEGDKRNPEYLKQKSIETKDEDIIKTEQVHPISKKERTVSSCVEAKELTISTPTLPNSNDDEISINATETSKIPNFKPASSLRRPENLALNTTSRSKSRRRWSVYEDMMSPLMENPRPVTELELEIISRGKSSSFSSTDSEFILKKLEKSELADSCVRSSLLNSFRKLSSPEDSTIYSSSGDSGKDSSSKMSYSDVLKQSFPLSDNKDSNVFPSSNEQSSMSKDKRNKPSIKTLLKEEDSLESYENVLLFIYSLGEMRLLLLLNKECVSDANMIQSLYEYGSSSIAELEVSVSNVEEQSMSMGTGRHDHYCYLHYEPVWRSLAHGGRNHSMDFDIVQHMHQDFHVYPNINELIIRGEDHVVYGYQCVGSEVFYQQSAEPQPGLPMPSDLMGKVPLKAKRRLERDHNILLI